MGVPISASQFALSDPIKRSIIFLKLIFIINYKSKLANLSPQQNENENLPISYSSICSPNQNIYMNVILPKHKITNDIPAGHQNQVKRLMRKKVVNIVPCKLSKIGIKCTRCMDTRCTKTKTRSS